MFRFRSVRTAAAVAAAAMVVGAIPVVAAPRQDVTPLPKPTTSGGMSLNEALSKRRSCAAYTDKAPTPAQIGQLCWAAQGITEPTKGFRTAPSAMTLYSIHVYVVDGSGVSEYIPKGHALKALQTVNLVAELRALVGKPANMGGAPAAIVLGVDLAPLEARTGARAEKFAAMEAGHVAQNVLLEATSIGLASIPVGGFDAAKVAALLKLPEGITPVYLLPVGTQASQ